MILSDKQIKQEIADSNIIITPYDENCLGSNSYDVHLSPHLATYTSETISFSESMSPIVLDSKKHNKVIHFDISDGGYMLKPGQLYLGVTTEFTYTKKHVPMLEGKSSLARLGCFIHCTSGFGDVQYRGRWTLEIVVTMPLIVYPGMKIGQLYYQTCGEVGKKYDEKDDAKYNNDHNDAGLPIESMMWKNFI